MRTIATALESYVVDNQKYPWPNLLAVDCVQDCRELTTPVAYLTSVNFVGPFTIKDRGATYFTGTFRDHWYHYYNYEGRASNAWQVPDNQKMRAFSILGWGPAANGTVSNGEIIRFGGAFSFPSFAN